MGVLENETDSVQWLGGRDSNPDSMVQSHVSYHWTTSQQDAEGTV